MYLNHDQQQAVLEAAKAAHMTAAEFTLLALQSLAIRYGVTIPDTPDLGIKPFVDPAKKAKGGRPPKPFGAMTRDVPVGVFGRICPLCKRSFRVDDEVVIYCSDECEKRAQNRRSYVRSKKS